MLNAPSRGYIFPARNISNQICEHLLQKNTVMMEDFVAKIATFFLNDSS